MMDSQIVWTRWDDPGLEHLHLSRSPDGSVEAESIVVGVADGRPFSLRYYVESDTSWRVRQCRVEALQGAVRIDLRSNGDGTWAGSDGEGLPELAGCIDVDIEATPYSNTLPIRRLNLQPGESREIGVVYVSVPTLDVSVKRQVYTCLERDRRYRFQSVDSGFTADLPVDHDGLVLDYPGLFRRVNLPLSPTVD